MNYGNSNETNFEDKKAFVCFAKIFNSLIWVVLGFLRKHSQTIITRHPLLINQIFVLMSLFQIG